MVFWFNVFSMALKEEKTKKKKRNRSTMNCSFHLFHSLLLEVLKLCIMPKKKNKNYVKFICYFQNPFSCRNSELKKMALGIAVDETGTAQNNQSHAPSAPPLESITAIDLNHVNFIVALDRNRNSEPISATKISINGSESLRRIINEKIDCDAKGNHLISNVDESEFRQLIEFLENKKLQFKDQNHRLQMFAVAKQFNCPEMQIFCLREVDDNLNVSNVLTVYRSLWYYGSLTSNKNPIDRKLKSNLKKSTYTADEYLTFLVFNVLQFISMSAENVLLSGEIDHLTFKEFENIVKQDDLLLRSEMVLINALTRWSREECRRRNIELTHENERTVLGELCFAPRYAYSKQFSKFFWNLNSVHF